jgi:hypothetical protein
MDILKRKYLNENLNEEELEEFRVYILNYAKMFFDDRIHPKTLITDLERERKTITGLKNMIETLVRYGIDPL